TAGVLADRLGALRLVDAHRADRAGALVQHVAADPADVVGHLLADPRRALGGVAQLLRRRPAAAAQDHVQVHGASSVVEWVFPNATLRAAPVRHIGRAAYLLAMPRRAASAAAWPRVGTASLRRMADT